SAGATRCAIHARLGATGPGTTGAGLAALTQTAATTMAPAALAACTARLSWDAEHLHGRIRVPCGEVRARHVQRVGRGVRGPGAGDDRGNLVPPRRAVGEAWDRPASLSVGEGGAVDVREDLIGRRSVADMDGECGRVPGRAHHDRVVDG